jgi:hypothetical protein
MYISGNSQKSLVKGKNGQIKSQKFGKGGRGASFANCQKNTCPDQGRARGGQYPLRKRGFADKRPPTQGLRQTERFNPVSVGMLKKLSTLPSFLVEFLGHSLV